MAWQKTQVTPSELTSRSFSKSFVINETVSWQGPHFTIVAPRVFLIDVKYILPKRRLFPRSAEACAEAAHCREMSTWQERHVWADWAFMLLRRSGGGV